MKQRSKPWAVSAAALVFAVTVFVACGGDDDNASSAASPSSTPVPAARTTTTAVTKRPSVTFTAREYAYDGPSEVPAGWVDLSVRNAGTLEHQAGIVELAGRETLADVQDAVAKNDPGLLGAGAFVGGPNNAAPGATATAIVHLDAGKKYALVCFIPAPDGKAHTLHGMIKEFSATDAGNTAPEPHADATATLADFNFTLPRPFPATGILAVVNHGAQVHEMIMYKLEPGKTLDDLKTYLLASVGGNPPAGPPPYTDIGSVVGLSPGKVNYLDLHLSKGTYGFLCFFPDAMQHGLPHALEGMLTVATVG